MKRCTRTIAFLLTGVLALAVVSCKREERSFHIPPAAAEMAEDVPYENGVRPGPATSPTASTTPPTLTSRFISEPYGREFYDNAQAQSDGERLYAWFNCVGCHANGGGGMGPPFTDTKWYYGSNPEQIYSSILEGRPNGMPSFRGRIPDYQIWELVAYVRSLSDHANPNAASGRQDHMAAAPPPNSAPPQPPQNVPEPSTGPATQSNGP